MIEIKNVSKSYKSGKKVVNNLNLKIENGEIFGFIGLNGAGKTTTIKMITGILNLDEGNILVDGIDIAKDPVKAKMNLGLVPDSPDMFLNFKGIEYLNFIADVYEVPTEIRIKLIDMYSKRFEMEKELDTKIEKYSHGMRQKIVIIANLLHSPKNLILDEPITGLDPKSSFVLREYANNGNTVFFSTHILEIAERLCDRVGIINEGNIIFTGTMNELKNKFGENKTLEEIFINIVKD